MAYRPQPRALINPVAVKEFRKARGYSQSEIERRTQQRVTQAYLSQIERGTRSPGLTVRDGEEIELDGHGRARIGLPIAEALAAALDIPLMAILAMPVRDCRQPAEMAS